MLGQQFAPSDIPTIITLIFLEGLLSADNALVLAILVQGLPEHQRKKGLLYGLAGAWILRGLCIVFATLLMRFWWIEAAGAAYLLYLAAKHFVSKAAEGGHGHGPKKVRSFWPTIVIVELTDLAFAVDSILAAVGLVGSDESKIWVIYLGGILGVVMMRFVAGFFLKLLEIYTRLETAAYLIIAWISVKLGVAAYAHFMEVVRHSEPVIHHLPDWLFWPVMVALFATGFIGGKKPADDAGDATPDADGAA